MLRAHGLYKAYGEVVAVDGISFSLKTGQILGLLGPNGAGKTTTVSMVAGILPPDAGQVEVKGIRLSVDNSQAKGLIGLVPQEIALIEPLSAWDNLSFFGSLYNLDKEALRKAIPKALAFVGLSQREKDRVSTFSGGMKRRLNLAISLLHDPEILLLDEPTVGVDPQSRLAIFENLLALKNQGKALLYTTHYLEEAERLCDYLLIMDHGKMIAEGTLQDLRKKLPWGNKLLLELEKPLTNLQIQAIQGLEGVKSVEVQECLLKLTLEELSVVTPKVFAWLHDHMIPYGKVESQKATLEDIFIALTGKGVRDL